MDPMLSAAEACGKWKTTKDYGLLKLRGVEIRKFRKCDRDIKFLKCLACKPDAYGEFPISQTSMVFTNLSHLEDVLYYVPLVRVSTKQYRPAAPLKPA